MVLYFTHRNPKTRDTITTKWQLSNTEIAKVWMNSLWLSDSPIVKYAESFPSLNDVYETSKLLETYVVSLNEIGAELPEWVASIDIDREKLNILHENFHKFEDRVAGRVDKASLPIQVSEMEHPEKIRVLDLFNKVNMTVHTLEGFDNVNKNRNIVHSYSCFRKFVPPELKPKVTDELRKDFVPDVEEVEPNQPWLSLSYATIGKNLWHCFQDNDTSIVRQELLSPQVLVSSDFNINVKQSKNPIRKKHQKTSPAIEEVMNKHLDKLYEWIKENNLEDHVDLEAAENRYIFTPCLAKLIYPSKTMSAEQVKELTSEYVIREFGLMDASGQFIIRKGIS